MTSKTRRTRMQRSLLLLTMLSGILLKSVIFLLGPTPKLTGLQYSDFINLCILVRVDNITYSVFGYAHTVPSLPLLTNTVISPTQTKLIMEAGSMQINLTILNPIEVRTKVTCSCHIIDSLSRNSLEIGLSNQSHSHICH